VRASSCDAAAAVESVCAAFGHMMFVDGLFSGDPHPGNLLLQPLASGDKMPS